MKNHILYTIFLLSLIPLVSKAASRDSTNNQYLFSVEISGVSSFYNLSKIDGGGLYKRAEPGLSYGSMFKYHFKNRFYIGVGGYFSSSVFKWDTTGLFPPGATFPAPPTIKKSYTYFDYVMVAGKKFNLYQNKLLAGVSAGLAYGKLIRGKEYFQGPFQTRISIFDNLDPQFSRNVRSVLISGTVSCRLFPRIYLEASACYRKYGVIDYYLELQNQNTTHPKTFYHNLWNYGISIQYNFLDKEKSKNWFKKKK